MVNTNPFVGGRTQKFPSSWPNYSPSITSNRSRITDKWICQSHCFYQFQWRHRSVYRLMGSAGFQPMSSLQPPAIYSVYRCVNGSITLFNPGSLPATTHVGIPGLFITFCVWVPACPSDGAALIYGVEEFGLFWWTRVRHFVNFFKNKYGKFHTREHDIFFNCTYHFSSTKKKVLKFSCCNY